jgi:hypothetical protein
MAEVYILKKRRAGKIFISRRVMGKVPFSRQITGI